MPDQDVRLQHLKVWLDEQLAILFADQGWGAVPPATLTAASSDASFRRYFRWEGAGRSFVVMDAPPPQENCKPFVDIAFLLAKSGINVPKIYAEDLERGFLLLNDLGNKTYLDVIDGENADRCSTMPCKHCWLFSSCRWLHRCRVTTSHCCAVSWNCSLSGM
jgi:aminoglycoside/choline kinase family phosphotransferase